MKIMKLTAGLLALLVFSANAVTAQKLKAEDVVAKHLESIGTAEARAAAKTLIAVGNGTAGFASNADLKADGRVVIASEGNKLFFGINLNSTSNRFADELYTFDGDSANAANPRQGDRSPLGKFVQSNKLMIEQGLFSGTFSTAWAMANLPVNKAKLSYDGLKKIDGRELHAIGYSKKGGGDVDVTLYFDKDTFQHVRTEYKRMSSAGIGKKPEDSTKFDETRFKVIEEFGDHRAEAGLTLPHSYRIVYSITGQSGTMEIEWKFNVNEFAANQKLDPTTFKTPTN